MISHPKKFLLFLIASLLLSGRAGTAKADVTLTYDLDLGQQRSSQSLHINGHRAWIKNFGDKGRWDLLFDAESTTWAVMDHQKREVLAFRRKDLNRIEGQINALAPLLQSLQDSNQLFAGTAGEAFQKLLKQRPQQGKGKAPSETSSWRVKPTGKSERLHRLSCQSYEVRRGPKEAFHWCRTDLSSLELPAPEKATLTRLLEEGQGVLSGVQNLAAMAGVPTLSEQDLILLAGLPLSMRSLTPNKPAWLRLKRIAIEAHTDTEPHLPENYRQRTLKLW